MLASQFFQVEGAIAVARIRPFDDIPLPFGNQWASPRMRGDFGSETGALYVATTRPPCLSEEEFRVRYRR